MRVNEEMCFCTAYKSASHQRFCYSCSSELCVKLGEGCNLAVTFKGTRRRLGTVTARAALWPPTEQEFKVNFWTCSI